MWEDPPAKIGASFGQPQLAPVDFGRGPRAGWPKIVPGYYQFKDTRAGATLTLQRPWPNIPRLGALPRAGGLCREGSSAASVEKGSEKSVDPACTLSVPVAEPHSCCIPVVGAPPKILRNGLPSSTGNGCPAGFFQRASFESHPYAFVFVVVLGPQRNVPQMLRRAGLGQQVRTIYPNLPPADPKGPYNVPPGVPHATPAPLSGARSEYDELMERDPVRNRCLHSAACYSG